MSRYLRAVGLFGIFSMIATLGWAGSHTWVVREIFSNPDGTIQYVELWTPGAGETAIGGKSVTSDNNTSPAFPANVPGPTTNRYLLLGTSHFANLPGAPALDITTPMQDNFFDIDGDEIQWHIYVPSILSFGPGELPTDGIRSLADDGSTTCGTPTNYAGDVFRPRDTSELRIGKLLPSLSRLKLEWESCLGNGDHHIVWGTSASLASYGLAGSRCDIGCSPYNWVQGVPNPAPGDWVWILLLANDDISTEGSWGLHSDGSERTNAAGHSGMCAITAKDASNTCQ